MFWEFMQNEFQMNFRTVFFLCVCFAHTRLPWERRVFDFVAKEDKFCVHKVAI